MNPLLKGAIAFGTVAGAGGTAYGIYNAMQPAPEKVKTYSEELEGTLLSTTDANYRSKWESRLTSLQGLQQDTTLIDVLKGLRPKKGTEQWKELRDWCQNIVKTPSKDKQSQEFDNVQNYCTYSIREKLGTNVILENEATDTSGKWTKAHTKLAATANLNKELTTAKGLTDGKGWEKVKTWCHSVYSNPYKGKTDPDFALAQQVCVSD